MARDAPTCHLVAISAVCLGLSLPEGLPASVNSPRLRRFSHSALSGCHFSISAWACKSTYVTACDNWYQAFTLAFSPRLRDKSWGGEDWKRG